MLSPFYNDKGAPIRYTVKKRESGGPAGGRGDKRMSKENKWQILRWVAVAAAAILLGLGIWMSMGSGFCPV